MALEDAWSILKYNQFWRDKGTQNLLNEAHGKFQSIRDTGSTNQRLAEARLKERKFWDLKGKKKDRKEIQDARLKQEAAKLASKPYMDQYRENEHAMREEPNALHREPLQGTLSTNALDPNLGANLASGTAEGWANREWNPNYGYGAQSGNSASDSNSDSVRDDRKAFEQIDPMTWRAKTTEERFGERFGPNDTYFTDGNNFSSRNPEHYNEYTTPEWVGE